MKKALIFTVILLLAGVTFGQKGNFKNSDWYVEPAFRYGIIIPTVERDSALLDYPLYGFDVRFGKQSSGSNEWEQWFNYPRYGVALRYEHNTYRLPDNYRLLGDNISALGFINGNIVKTKVFIFDYTIMGGFAYWFKKYSPDENNPQHENKFIGTHINVHLSLDFGVNFIVSKHVDVFARGLFSHSSNGAVKLPNWGVNMVTGQIGARYHINERAQEIRTIDTVKFVKKNSLFISEAPGFLESNKDNKYYFGNTLQIGYLRTFDPRFSYGGGIDIFFSHEVKSAYEEKGELENYNAWKSMNFAVSALFEINYNRFVFHVGGGVYVYQPAKYLPNYYKPYYERLGFKCLLGKNRNHYVGAMLKAHLDSIDYVEWMYGFKFYNWGKKK